MDTSNNEEQSNAFFGFEMGDTFTYGIVLILAVVFIRQISVLF